MGQKKVLLITSGQPSLNPRLVKEADALANTGYNVTVLHTYWNNWGADFDKKLLPAKKWQAVCVGGDPANKRRVYFLSRLISKIAQSVSNKTKGKLMADWAAARATYFLIREAKKHQADLYIGHNLGALPAVVAAARANNKPCGFDAEDFHRNETSDDSANADVVLKTKVEDKYLPLLNYFTTSSPQIAEAYQVLYPLLKINTLLNVFPAGQNKIRHRKDPGPLKLLWFSQTIGPNRGLQDIVGAMQLLDKEPYELHLLGSKLHTSPNFIKTLTGSGINLQMHDPIHPDDLTAFAGRFDIGLALEPGFSINNNLALSNKIFTYMQAGLAIVASDTAAQQDLLSKNPTIGRLYPKGNAKALAAVLANYNQDREKLISTQNEALRLSHSQYNWEVESQKFLAIVKQTLSDN
jgi:glycosyltransferase involved in cell wall biosynthesis